MSKIFCTRFRHDHMFGLRTVPNPNLEYPKRQKLKLLEVTDDFNPQAMIEIAKEESIFDALLFGRSYRRFRCFCSSSNEK